MEEGKRGWRRERGWRRDREDGGGIERMVEG